MIKIGGTGWESLLDAEIFRLQELLLDLQRLRSGEYPSHGELSTAVLLVNPVPAAAEMFALAGLAVGHPQRGTATVVTSPIEVMSKEGWARTSNRLYRFERHQ